MILLLTDFANERIVDLEHAAGEKLPRVCLFGSRCFVVDCNWTHEPVPYRETMPRHVEFSARAKGQPVRSDDRPMADASEQLPDELRRRVSRRVQRQGEWPAYSC